MTLALDGVGDRVRLILELSAGLWTGLAAWLTAGLWIGLWTGIWRANELAERIIVLIEREAVLVFKSSLALFLFFWYPNIEDDDVPEWSGSVSSSCLLLFFIYFIIKFILRI